MQGNKRELTPTAARDDGQLQGSAAEVYAEFFVPALFAEWPARVLDAVGVRAGESVLDVACGTGVLTRAAATRVGQDGEVVGLDINANMLAMAKQRAPEIEWRSGAAEQLPFAAASFDRVVSQFGLMFFADRVQALREMRRVVGPGGKVAVAVWGSLDKTPGYAAMVALLEQLFGASVADKLRAPYILGDVDALHALCAAAGMPDAQLATHTGTARFPSLQQWVYTDIKGWTLADDINDAQYTRLLQAAEEGLQQFVTPEGTVEFDAPAHIITVEA